jgi:hypothetical protein
MQGARLRQNPSHQHYHILAVVVVAQHTAQAQKMEIRGLAVGREQLLV